MSMANSDSRWLLGPVYALIVLAIVAGTVLLYPPLRQKFNDTFLHPKSDVVVVVGEGQFVVERVTTPSDMAKGLSGRTSLVSGHGMLFDFADLQYNATFWMKDMKFPIDIIWILDNRVVSIDRRVPNPEIGEQPVTRTFSGTISQVLEVNANEAGNIAVGDRVLVTTQ